MRSMTRWMLAGFMALAALGAVAVLDVGSPTADAAPSVSPFAGSWSGTWGRPGHNGTFDWTISDAGRLSGRTLNTVTGVGGEIRGEVRADGYIVFIGFAPSDDPASYGAGYAFRGTAVIDDDGKLVATLIFTATPFATDFPLVAILERN